MSDPSGRSVRLFLADGTSTGVLTAEVMNWTGHVLSAPRSSLVQVLTREEVSRTGVYLIVGPDPEGSDLPWIYVGESDEISNRLKSHSSDASKGDWERLVCITSKDMNLTKAHVKYLEARILDLLHSAKKSIVGNGNNPSFDKLPESDISDMESFIREIELIMPVIGIDALRRPMTNSPQKAELPIDSEAQQNGSEESEKSETHEEIFSLINEKLGIEASAIELNGEFVIITGSTGSLQAKESFHKRQKTKREEAFSSGRAELLGDQNFILRDYIAFGSPSAASVFLFGTSRNGRTDWVNKRTGEDYGTWKAKTISDALGEKIEL